MSLLGELLSELRKDRSLTQKDIADYLHVTVGTISNYENNVHYPDLEKLLELADYFHVTTDYLLGRSTVNLSPEVYSEQIADGMTVGEMVELIKALPPKRRGAFLFLLRELSESDR